MFSSVTEFLFPFKDEKRPPLISFELETYFERWLEPLRMVSSDLPRVLSHAVLTSFSKAGYKSCLLLTIILHIPLQSSTINNNYIETSDPSCSQRSNSCLRPSSYSHCRCLPWFYDAISNHDSRKATCIFVLFWLLILYSYILKKEEQMSEPVSPLLERRSKSTRIRKRLHKKVLSQKENNFVLDCLNQQKAHLEPYNSTNDKFLNYFVIRVHPNMAAMTKTHKKLYPISRTQKTEQNEQNNHDRFQQMLQKAKAKLSTKGNPTPPSESLQVIEKRGENGERNEGSGGKEALPCIEKHGSGAADPILISEEQSKEKSKSRQETIQQKVEGIEQQE